jgi:hypothetical protein
VFVLTQNITADIFTNHLYFIRKEFIILYHGKISGSHGGEYKEAVFWVVAPCSLVEVYRRFRVLAASIIRAMNKPQVAYSETSVNLYPTTRRNIPEDSHLHFV